MEIINVPIKDLVPNEKNPRKITKREMNKLIRSIEEFGFVDPIIVNKNKTRYNIVVGGHRRLEAAKKLKMKDVPVTYVDMTRDREQLLNIALNEISGEWNDDKLFILLKELEENESDLTLTGINDDKLLALLKKEDKIIHNPTEQVVKSLGRLMIECPNCKTKFSKKGNETK